MRFNVIYTNVLIYLYISFAYGFKSRLEVPFQFAHEIQTSTHKFEKIKRNGKIKVFLKDKDEYIDNVRGAQCYLPEEQRIQRWLQKKWDSASKKFGFQEYSMPVLTNTSIFSNRDTPLDNEHYKELYSFKDKNGRDLSLRGDITPQFMNMLKSLPETEREIKFQINKWYTVADCWRYERPSYCRRRNHVQWNADIVGISNMEVELELISLLIHFFESVQLSSKDVKISLNHRNLTPQILSHLGVKCDSPQWTYKFSKILDKYKKTPRDEWDKMAQELGLSSSQCSELHRIIESSKTLEEFEKIIGQEHLVELKKLITSLEEKGLSDWVEIDLTIVRGNDYYTGIVFECFDRSNLLKRSLAGGGRYDRYFHGLATLEIMLNSDSDPVLKHSAGFGMGNIAILNLLKHKNLLPQSSSFIDVLVFTPTENTGFPNETSIEETEDYLSSKKEEWSSENDCKGVPGLGEGSPICDTLRCSNSQRRSLYNLMEALRKSDFSVYHYYKTSKIKKALKFADRSRAKFVLMPFSQDDHQAIAIKNLHTKTQECLDVSAPNLEQLVIDKIRRHSVPKELAPLKELDQTKKCTIAVN